MLDTFKRYDYEEIKASDFYHEVFKLDDDYLQNKDDEAGLFKTNPIGIGMNNKKPFKRIMFKDEFETNLKELQKAEFSILSGLTYFGRKNTMANASKAFALIFDIDHVSEKELGNYLFGIKNEVYPKPTFIVMSGSGIHAYYVFDKPIDLYPKTKLLLKELKFELTDLMWNGYTSGENNKQFQGINQGFRIVGSPTKRNSNVRAFKSPSGTVSLSYMNSFVQRKELDFSQLYKESTMPLAEAKEKYPEWYEKIVVLGKPKGTWTTHEGLYEWWFNKIKKETTYGHRYYAIMALAIYAIKSYIPYERLEKDAFSLMSAFNKLNEEEPFTDYDVRSALECYDVRYKTFPRYDIEKITAIDIPINKRNGRSQKNHIEIMNAIRDVVHKEGSWRYKQSSKEKEVKEYIEKNPNASPTEISRALKISRPTVYKYL